MSVRKVKLNQSVIYRGRKYVAGEPIMAEESFISAWDKNGLIMVEPDAPFEVVDDSPTPTAESVTADGKPGKDINGDGSEGTIPGKIGRSGKGKKNG